MPQIQTIISIHFLFNLRSDYILQPMKLTMNKIFLLVVILLSFNQAFSDVPPPPPPTPPPGTPIDSGLVILFFIAISLGYYISTKIHTKKSA